MSDQLIRLLLWIVLINGGLVLMLILMRGAAGRWGFAAILTGVCGLAGLLIALGASAHFLAYVTVGAFVFLVIVPLIVHAATIWALRRGKIDLAIRLTGLRELLQPGLGVGREREFLQFLRQVQRGHGDDILETLRIQAENETDPVIKYRLQEQLIIGLLRQRRGEEAGAYARDSITADAIATRPRLGMALITLHSESDATGELVRTMFLLENGAAAEDPAYADELDDCRVKVLAFTGQAAALGELLGNEEGFCQTRPPRWRAFWLGVARERSGDAEGARQAYAHALDPRGADPELQALIQSKLDGLVDGAEPVAIADRAQAAKLSDAIKARVALARRMPRMRGAPLTLTPVTVGLTVFNLAVFGALYLFGEGSTHTPTLIRAGANFKNAVTAGEWWRLASAMFLHYGPVHLTVNVLMLWFLGRFAEQMISPAEFFAVYVVSGVGGNLLSYLISSGGVSVGASSSLSGVLGAALIVLAASRGRLPEAWRRSMVLLMALFIGVSFLPGLDLEEIDNAAHLGGLIGGGALMGFLIVVQRTPLAKLRGAIMIVLCATCAAGLGYTGWSLTRSDLKKLPWIALKRPSVSARLDLELRHPVTWLSTSRQRGHVLFMQNILTGDTVQLRWLGESESLPAVLEGAEAHMRKRMRTVAPPHPGRLRWLPDRALPRGWRGFEASYRNAKGDRLIELHVFTLRPRRGKSEALRAVLSTEPRRTEATLETLSGMLRTVRVRR